MTESLSQYSPGILTSSWYYLKEVCVVFPKINPTSKLPFKFHCLLRRGELQEGEKSKGKWRRRRRRGHWWWWPPSVLQHTGEAEQHQNQNSTQVARGEHQKKGPYSAFGDWVLKENPLHLDMVGCQLLQYLKVGVACLYKREWKRRLSKYPRKEGNWVTSIKRRNQVFVMFSCFCILWWVEISSWKKNSPFRRKSFLSQGFRGERGRIWRNIIGSLMKYVSQMFDIVDIDCIGSTWGFPLHVRWHCWFRTLIAIEAALYYICLFAVILVCGRHNQHITHSSLTLSSRCHNINRKFIDCDKCECILLLSSLFTSIGHIIRLTTSCI